MSIYACLVSCSMRATLFLGKPLRQPGGVVSGFWRGDGFGADFAHGGIADPVRVEEDLGRSAAGRHLRRRRSDRCSSHSASATGVRTAANSDPANIA